VEEFLILLIFVGALFFLLFSGWWVFFTLGAISILAYVLLAGGVVGNLPRLMFNTIDSYYLLALPLFVFMGTILTEGGLAERLFDAITPFTAFLRGGLIHAAVLANTVLGACCGSTVAATSSISAVAIPEMSKRGYAKTISYGSLASSGLLAGLIPPSIPLIVIAILSDESIAKLFIAGIIPGLLLASTISLVTVVLTTIRPELAPSSAADRARISARTILPLLGKTGPALILVAIVIGSIYMGMATPTEASSMGVVGALAISARRLNVRKIHTSAIDAIRVSGSIVILLGVAAVYGYALHYLGLGEWIQDFLAGLPGGPMTKMYCLIPVYLVLGMFLDAASLTVIIVPILLPFVKSLGLSPLWFGVWSVVNTELGCITPPVGLTLYAVQATSRDKLETIAKGALPYWISFLIVIVLIMQWPALVLWLPELGFL